MHSDAHKCHCESPGAEAVGEEGAFGVQPGGAAEVGRLSGLEVVEVSPATAAAGKPLACSRARLAPLHALRGRILQPGDTERFDTRPRAWRSRLVLCVAMALSVVWSRIPAIDEEWQRTQCMPRETCVDVAKELGTDPSMFFKPPCVSVYRFVSHCTTCPCKWPVPPRSGALKLDFQMHNHSRTERDASQSTGVFIHSIGMARHSG